MVQLLSALGARLPGYARRRWVQASVPSLRRLKALLERRQ